MGLTGPISDVMVRIFIHSVCSYREGGCVHPHMPPLPVRFAMHTQCVFLQGGVSYRVILDGSFDDLVPLAGAAWHTLPPCEMHWVSYREGVYIHTPLPVIFAVCMCAVCTLQGEVCTALHCAVRMMAGLLPKFFLPFVTPVLRRYRPIHL